MATITVATVSYYSGPLISNLFDSMEQTAKDSQLSYLVCDNTGGEDEQVYNLLKARCKIVSMKPQTPSVWRGKARSASYAHGQALNLLFSQIETEIAIFVDPDCRLLLPGWDGICKGELRNAIAVGAPYHARKITKYNHFPSPIFIAFRTHPLRQLGADWTPYLLSPIVELQDQVRRLAAILGTRAGELIMGDAFYLSQLAELMRNSLGSSSKDTGWRVARSASAQNRRSVLFTPALDAGQIKVPFRKREVVLTLMRKYELFLWEGVPILTHFYGSGHKGQRNAKESLAMWQALAAEAVRT